MTVKDLKSRLEAYPEDLKVSFWANVDNKDNLQDVCHVNTSFDADTGENILLLS